jgi:hypothetical protein
MNLLPLPRAFLYSQPAAGGWPFIGRKPSRYFFKAANTAHEFPPPHPKNSTILLSRCSCAKLTHALKFLTLNLNGPPLSFFLGVGERD